ncbi:hypothetical protein [Promicromonospora panici]|uniref:hypothetical protein n=1 Tax=Promicromonospora panici TaxID=2219658 RepID=UPI0013EC1023|nr:hypothetical protein [Promicromonospora panici]
MSGRVRGVLTRGHERVVVQLDQYLSLHRSAGCLDVFQGAQGVDAGRVVARLGRR